MRCETGEFPIKIIQGDSYRRVYKFYDTDGNVMDNSVISSVVLSVSRLNYTQTLNWNASEEGYVFILSADTTAEFPYCKGTYDVTLNFRDTQVSTQVYQSSWQIFEKDVFYNTITNNKGYMTCENSEVVIKTGITVSAGGAGGTDDHNLLYNRNLPNQHPMSAITGLEDALEGKQPSGDYATTEELDELAEIVEGKADSGDIPTKTSELENDSGFITAIPSEYVTDSELTSALQDVRDDIPTKTSDIENDSDFVDQDYVDGIEETLQDSIDGVQQDVDNIEAVISTQATPTNKLVSASEMGDAISAVEAKQLYATSSQGSFATKAQLLSATTFYNADGTVATPTKNDIAYVLADESHDGKSAKYVIADITASGIVWGFVITFSDTTFTQSQMDAINSGVTSQKVSTYDGHIANKSNPHEVTYQQLGGTNPSYTKGETDDLLDDKQPIISDLATIRSGAALGATALQNADIYIPNGLDKTGATDMSTVIQTAINGGTVYLPVGTYRIDNTLSIIGKTFVCDGEIVANGCDAIKVTGEYSNVKIKKITATGHTCVIVGGDRWTSDNVVNVEFASGAIGFAVGSDTKHTQYTTIKFERITATQYGIYCWCGGGKYNNETLIYGGAIGGTATKGIYTDGANEVRVMFASIEGVVEEGTGVEFENSSYNQILGLRTGEGYGRYAFSFKGSSSYNFINTHTLNLQDLDISTLSASSVGNVIRGKICSKSIEWEYIANEVYIDGYVGVSFVPLANVEAYIAASSISPTTIDDVSYRVVSYANLNKVIKVVNLVYGDSVVTNFMLGREYYDEHSAYFGNSITFKAWAGNKPKFYDSDANLIADFSGGVDSDCKIVIRCIGSTYQNSAYEAQWEVLTIGTNNNVAQLPKNVSAFNNDSGYLTLSTLPIYDGGVE